MQQLQDWIAKSRRIVFFGGAGVSTESGIPDFRSEDGLYHQKYRYPPETIVSHSFFMAHPEEFFAFYRERMIYPDAKPNAAHLALAKLEQEGKLSCVVTQNIDGLHQLAGSKNVVELHGSIHRNRCTNCKKPFSLQHILNTPGVPRCDCGGMIKPDVVLYEEPLDPGVMDRAIDAISHADMLIVGGTSLSVYPAAGLLRFYSGTRLVLINKTPTQADGHADLVLHEGIGKVLSQAVE